MLAYMGPSIMPIINADAPYVRIADTPKAVTAQKYRSLIWYTPTGWERLQGPNGMSLYVSKESENRAWGVRVRKSPSPLDINKVLNEWDERLSALSMIRTETATQQIESRHPAPLYQREYASTDGTNGFVRLRVGIKGLHIYEELWKVSGDEKSHLNPLLTRLDAETVWGPSSQYVDAKRDFERRRNRKSMARFGMALLEWGEVQEATTLFRILAEEFPTRTEGWSGLLKAAQWYAVDDQRRLHDLATTIFETNPDPKLLASLAVTMHDLGQKQRARALLDASWERLPGDRSLRRQRRNQGLSTALHDGTPSYLFWNPENGASQTPDSPPVGPITNAELDARTKRMSQQSEELIDKVTARLKEKPRAQHQH